MRADVGFQISKALRRIALVGSVVLLVGCAGYNQKMTSTMGATKSGTLDAALADLEKNNSSKEKDLLFYLEKGELQRMKGDYGSSRDTWLQADEKIRQWEESVKVDSSKVLGNVGSFLINDTTRRYDGRDYEKVFVSVRLALNHLALDNFDAARTEIKKMHERESIIAEFRAKELAGAKEEAEKKGLKATTFKELNGYPVETLNAPEVQALKNSYESAFANYLAGFVYEALDEPSLATAGYRKAIEMRPGDSTLEDGLNGIDSRISRVRQNQPGVDTLFVVETGDAPTIVSRTLPLALPIPSETGFNMVMTPISWPILNPVDLSVIPSSIILDDKPHTLVLITSVDQMARRALADEMPGIIIRSSIRAIVKGAAQKQMQDKAAYLGAFGSLLSVAASVTAMVTENADERTWRTLPAFYSVGRAMLTPGLHTVSISTPTGPVTRNIQVSGKHAVIVIRASGNSIYLAQNQTPIQPVETPIQPEVGTLTTPESVVKPAEKNLKQREIKRI